jgi:peptidase A4-like protein
MIALGVAIPVLVVGYFLASAGAQHAVPAADVQGTGPVAILPGAPGEGGAVAGTSAAPGTPSMGGWGEGGYPMVAGSPSNDGQNDGQAANAPDGDAAAVTDVASENWAGYAATGAANSFTSVSSSWAQPAVNCDGAAGTFSAFWVGLDGDGTPTVEQTGTEADCADGTASYQGWYEIFPNAPVFFPSPVQPGDAMSASVVSDGNGTFTLTLADSTQGWQQSTQQAEAGAQLGSAEIIAEAPSNGTVLPLADFGTVNFTDATVDNAPIGNSANLSELTMESPAGAALATPSALTAGNAFSVTSDSASSVTTPTPSAGTSTGTGGGTGTGRRHHHWGF